MCAFLRAVRAAHPIQGGNARLLLCKQRNYNTVKNKKNTSDRLERSKYCPFCRKHTKHVETK